MSAIHELAARFVALTLSIKDWASVESLPESDQQTLLDVLVAAGFESPQLTTFKLPVWNLDQDGSKIDISHHINDGFPYAVSTADNQTYRATGWLISILRLARRENAERAPEAICAEIERSVPLEPIKITVDGDYLKEYPPQRDFVGDHTRDSDELSGVAGIHAHCGGWMDRHGATAEKDALVCRSCHIRVLFPKTVTTYGELRETLSPSAAAVAVPA